MPPARRSFLADTLSVVRTRVVIQVVGVVTSIITARYLGPDGKGLVAALTVAPAILNTFAELGVRQAAAYHIGRKLDQPAEVVASVTSLAVLTGALSIALCIGYALMTWRTEYSWLLVALAVAGVPLGIFRSYMSGVFLGLQQIARFNAVGWIPPTLVLALVLVLVAGAGLGPLGVLLSSLLAFGLMTVVVVRMVLTVAPIRFGFDPGLLRRLIGLGLVYAVALFMMTLNYKVGIVLLNKMGTLEDVGLFTLGVNLAELIWEIPAAVGVLVFARSANAHDDGAFSRRVLVLMRLAFLAAVAAGACLVVLGPLLIPLVYGAEFAPSAHILNWMLPGTIAFALFLIANRDLAGKGKPWVSLLVVGPGLALNVGLGLVLIPLYGAVGAAMAASASYVLATVAFLVLYCRIQGFGLADLVAYRRADLRMLADRVPLLRRVPVLGGWVK